MGDDVDDARLVMWVHGHCGRFQTTTGFEVEWLGYYVRAKARVASDVWVHYSVPTLLEAGERSVENPVLAHDVVVRLRTWGKGHIAEAHLWSGSDQIAEITKRVTSPHGAQSRGGTDDPILTVPLGLPIAAETRVNDAFGVSLRLAAEEPRDALAIAAVGVQLR